MRHGVQGQVGIGGEQVRAQLQANHTVGIGLQQAITRQRAHDLVDELALHSKLVGADLVFAEAAVTVGVGIGMVGEDLLANARVGSAKRVTVDFGRWVCGAGKSRGGPLTRSQMELMIIILR